MVKSKIPLPSKRPAQSSIPLPTKCLGTQSEKLPLNSKKGLVSKKPASVKQVQSISSKVRKENIVQRLPSSNSYDSKKVLTKEPSFNDRKAVAKSTLTAENKLKETKTVPVRPPKILVSKQRPVTNDESQPKRFSSHTSQNGKSIVRSMSEQKATTKSVNQPKSVPVRPPKLLVSKSRPVTENDNQPKRFSSYTSQNGKSVVRTMNEQKAAAKSVIQSKVVNEAKNSNAFSTNSMKENMNRDLLGITRKENVAVITPMRQINLAAKSGPGVDDSEFKKSGFFKSLILNERELSPGIINYCSKFKFSPSKANLLQLQPKASPRFLTADEFVEDVKRTSSKYYRLNGRLVLRSPEMTPDKIFQKVAKDIDSVKENLNIRQVDEVRRLSEFRRQSSLNVDGLLTNRRWTCNVPSKPSIASMNVAEIAAEIRRVSEIRRESGAQIYKKAPFLEYPNSVEKLNPSQRALQELEFLTTKKKDKTKKKVTFLIPSSGSPDLTPELSKPEAKLSDILEGSSNNCTPELDFGNGRVTTNSQTVDSAENVEDTSVITTPELNLTTYKLEFDVAKYHNETLPFDLSHKNDDSTNNKSSINQAVSLEIYVSQRNSEQFSQNFSSNLTALKPDFILSKFSSLKISENNVCTLQDIPGSNPSSENNLTSTSSYSEFSGVKSTDCLFQSEQNLTVPTNYKPVNETEKFCVKTEKQVHTPHPIYLHSKSNIPPSVSPTFLSRKFTTLDSIAPIYTPFVLKTLSQSPEVNLSHVRQKLDFIEKPNQSMDRRESQIILQTIPTIQKMNDFLCDQECIILSSQCSEKEIFCRNLMNPVACTLSNGDEMHFMPINSP